jgi:hypothetical protein
MPPNGLTLGGIIQTNVNANMGAISGHFPLSQSNPSYFIELCNSIGQGIISGGPSINFTTNDTGLQGSPLVQGTGTGIGIIVDASFIKPNLYTRIRNYVIADFGRTQHSVFPPPVGNSGQYLEALCNGIADSIASYYTTAWSLNSTHPQIYSGTGLIVDGNFSGIFATTIQGSIQSFATNLVGPFWPRLAQAISEIYVEAIENHSTGTVTITGSCNPSITQICGINATGNGTGVAS